MDRAAACRRAMAVALVGVLAPAGLARGDAVTVERMRNATVIPVAGGGVEPVRDGAVATRVLLEEGSDPVRIALLPDRTPVLTANSQGFTRLFSVGRDGRLHALPLIPSPGPCGSPEARLAGADPVVDVSAARDGALLATTECSRTVYRLAPGAAGWQTAATLTWQPPPDAPFLTRLLLGGELNDGSILVSEGTGSDHSVYGAWRAGAGNSVRLASVPGTASSLIALPTGGIAFTHGGRIVRVDGDAARTLRDAPELPQDRPEDLAPTPDGGVLVADPERMVVLEPSGVPYRISARAGLGSGDGGPARRARIRAAEVAASPDASALVLDGIPEPDTELRGRVRLRLLGPGGADQRAWGQIAPATYRALRQNTVRVRSSIAANARITVLRGSREVAHAQGAITPGTTDLRLRPKLPAAQYTVRLDVDGPAGAYSDRLTVITLKQLSTRRAGEAADVFLANRGDSDDATSIRYESDTCARRTRIRVDCRIVQVERNFDEDGAFIGGSTACVGRVAVTLAPDGLRFASLPGCRLPRSRAAL